MGIIVSKVRGSLRNTSKKTRADYLRIQQNKHHNVINTGGLFNANGTINSTGIVYCDQIIECGA